MSRLSYLLLVPPMILVGFWITGLAQNRSDSAATLNVLVGVAYWILMFLIVNGGIRGWRSVRPLIVLFILLNFGSLFYAQVQGALSTAKMGLWFMKAAIMSAIFYALFWPATQREKLSEASPAEPVDEHPKSEPAK
jgi:hypothetical protein